MGRSLSAAAVKCRVAVFFQFLVAAALLSIYSQTSVVVAALVTRENDDGGPITEHR